MPSGKAPFPSKKSVDSGKADKAKAVRGGYERSKKTQEGLERRISRKTGMTRAPGPGESTNARGEYTPRKKRGK